MAEEEDEEKEVIEEKTTNDVLTLKIEIERRLKAC